MIKVARKQLSKVSSRNRKRSCERVRLEVSSSDGGVQERGQREIEWLRGEIVG